MKLVSFENRTEEERVQAAWGTGKYMHRISFAPMKSLQKCIPANYTTAILQKLHIGLP
jgi:hypothetical protein